MIVRPIDVQNWVDLGLDGREIDSGGDAVRAQEERIVEFLAAHQNLMIDGRAVEPEFERANFLRRTLRTSIVIDPPEELDVYSATLGVIFVAPTEGLSARGSDHLGSVHREDTASTRRSDRRGGTIYEDVSRARRQCAVVEELSQESDDSDSGRDRVSSRYRYPNHGLVGVGASC